MASMIRGSPPTAQGQFSIGTPTALSGHLGVYPDVGMEQFTAGPSVLRYAAQNVTNNESVVASLDQTGSGSFTVIQDCSGSRESTVLPGGNRGVIASCS